MSYSYINNCTDDFIKYPCELCPSKEKGRIRGFALIEDGYTIADPTNPVDWAAGVDQEKIYLVPNTDGSLTVTPVEGTGVGDTELEIEGYDFVLQVMDLNLKNSCLAATAIAGNKNYKPAYVTETQVWIGDTTASVAVTAPVEEDIKSKVSWVYDVKWFQESPVCPEDKPANTFDRCITVV